MAGETKRTPDPTLEIDARRRHEVADHTADARVHAWAGDLPGLFEEAAAALSTLTVEIAPGAAAPEWVETDIEGHDLEHLAFAWLNELIALAEVRHRALASADVAELWETGNQDPRRAWRLRGRVGLLPFDPELVRAVRHAKAATLHGLDVARDADGWTLSAVVDI